jgi:hypothetical protein
MLKAVISSPFATQSGYGHHAREIITNLIERKGNDWDIKLLSMPWGVTPFTYPISDDWKQRTVPLPLQFQPDVFVQITVPTEFQPIGKLNIGVTAGTEGDICPPEWIDHINKMQIVVVPTNFTKDVFVNTAKAHNKPITCNLIVIPEYFDELVYTTLNAGGNLDVLDQIEEQFAFLSVGHWLTGNIGEDRKNVSGVIYSFVNAFKGKKSMPALILKTSGATYSTMDRMDIENRIEQVLEQQQFNNTKLPNIYLLHGDLTDIEMNSLYNHPKVKAMYSLTKAEGFGRPLLEFATTGKPLIVPFQTGQKDFLNQEFIVEVKGQLTPIHPSAQNEFLVDGAKWFTPDYTYAENLLKDVFDKYKNYIDNGKRLRYHVNQGFTKSAVQPKYDELVNSINEFESKIPKQVQLKLPKLQKVGE